VKQERKSIKEKAQRGKLDKIKQEVRKTDIKDEIADRNELEYKTNSKTQRNGS